MSMILNFVRRLRGQQCILPNSAIDARLPACHPLRCEVRSAQLVHALPAIAGSGAKEKASENTVNHVLERGIKT